MKLMKTTILAGLLMFVSSLSFAQGTTTAAINGRVIDSNGETLPGATVQAVNESTGAKYAGITNATGNFNLLNMNVGGPYTITIYYVGYEDYVKKNVYLNLGQTFRIEAQMSETAVELEEVVIQAKRVQDFRVIDGNRTGAETVDGEEQITNMPTINRDLAD